MDFFYCILSFLGHTLYFILQQMIKLQHFFISLPFKHIELLCFYDVSFFPNNRCIIIFVLLFFFFFKTFQALNWVFVVDTMNFSFWPERESQQCEVTYKGITYTGYMTLCAAISRAMDEGESTCGARYTLLIMCGWFYCSLFCFISTPQPNSIYLKHFVTLDTVLSFKWAFSSNIKTKHLENLKKKLVLRLRQNEAFLDCTWQKTHSIPFLNSCPFTFLC